VNTISINGLTLHQVSLLDTMWKIQETQELEEWCETLSESDRHQVELLINMVIMATTDELLVADVSQAQDYLQKFRL
jgi:hypothetical protein